MSEEEEEWRDIPGFPGCQASSLGRVRADRYGRAGRVFRRLALMKPSEGGYGYWVIGLRRGPGDIVQKRVHQWVALAFYGHPPAGHQVRHLDGDRKNNRATNLKYGTVRENALDKIAHGTLMRGEGHPSSKLSDAEVDEIRLALTRGEKGRSLAAKYGVSPALITYIKQGKVRNWSNQSPQESDAA